MEEGAGGSTPCQCCCVQLQLDTCPPGTVELPVDTQNYSRSHLLKSVMQQLYVMSCLPLMEERMRWHQLLFAKAMHQ